MGRRPIGVVKDLFRYPVKSMLGERLIEVDIGESGVIGDRAYALREASGRVVTAKKWPALFEFSARYDRSPSPGETAPLGITLPDGRTIQAQDPDASSLLSAVLGRAVRLERAASGQRSHAEIDPATVFGDVPVGDMIPGQTASTLPDVFALPAGTLFDSAAIHVLTSGTLAYMRKLIGEDADLDPRRFRPNIVVQTAPGVEGFVEDDWLEGTLEVGEAVRIVRMRPALRCVMTTHPQADLERDRRVLRAAAQHHQGHVGVFAAIGAPGKVRLDDSVVLVT
jgi:MOSC domain-containing protein